MVANRKGARCFPGNRKGAKPERCQVFSRKPERCNRKGARRFPEQRFPEQHVVDARFKFGRGPRLIEARARREGVRCFPRGWRRCLRGKVPTREGARCFPRGWRRGLRGKVLRGKVPGVFPEGVFPEVVPATSFIFICDFGGGRSRVCDSPGRATECVEGSSVALVDP